MGLMLSGSCFHLGSEAGKAAQIMPTHCSTLWALSAFVIALRLHGRGDERRQHLVGGHVTSTPPHRHPPPCQPEAVKQTLPAPLQQAETAPLDAARGRAQHGGASSSIEETTCYLI